MKKSLFLAVILVMFLIGSVCAAPLDDYSKAGNVGLSVWLMHAGLDTDRKYNPDMWFPGLAKSYDSANKWNWGGELTVAFAPKWAAGFEYADTRGKFVHVHDWGWGNTNEKSKLSSALFKIKYQAYKNERLFVAPYIGLARNKVKNSTSHYSPIFGDMKYDYKSESRKSILAGVTAVYSIDRSGRFKTYFDGAVGNKMYSWNVGVSYQVAKNLDFDFGYKHYMVKDLKYKYVKDTSWGTYMDNGKIKSTSRGIYLGLSYKFT